MVQVLSLVVIGISVLISTLLVGKNTSFSLINRAQEGSAVSASCQSLVLEKEQIFLGEEVKISAGVGGFGIIRYAKVEKAGDRVSGSTEPVTLLEGEKQLAGSFKPDEPGVYVFEVNAYDSSACNSLCTAGKILYQRTSGRTADCLVSGIWQKSGNCTSENCVAWLTVKEGESSKLEKTLAPTPAVDAEDCYLYIPASLYGADSRIWGQYQCVGGRWQINQAAGLSAAILNNQNNLEVENLQTPSTKNFTSSVQTGEAIVSYPIAIPPAAGGFAPSASLSYSSGAVEDLKVGLNTKPENWNKDYLEKFKKQGSMVGLGWNLSGIPQLIKNSGQKYNLVLGGQSYEMIFDKQRTAEANRVSIGEVERQIADYSGNAAYKPAYYKTEPESFIRIVRGEVDQGLLSWNWDVRPWDIWAKDGTYYRFEKQGFIINREHACQPHIPGSCKEEHLCDSGNGIKFKNRRDYYSWAIVKAEDISGNKIVYGYDESQFEYKNIDGGQDGSNCGSTGDNMGGNPSYPRAIYPTKITYGKDLQNKIEFSYTGREDKNIQDADNRYRVNFFGEKKLSGISVYLGSNLLRRYELNHTYADGSSAGYLLLTGVTVKDKQGNAFPVSQSFSYYPNNSSEREHAFLLKAASNGFGGTTEYYYEQSGRESINPVLIEGGWVYSGPSHSLSRNRIKQLVSKSSFTPEKKQKTVYTYPVFNQDASSIGYFNYYADASYCKSLNGKDCYNPHAVMQNEAWVDFEFLGYHYVAEENYYTERSGSDADLNDLWVKDLSNFYIFNQGIQEIKDSNNQVYSFKPLLYKGTLAKKIAYDSAGKVIALEENNYADSGGSYPYVYLKEARSCSDLEVADPSLRRGAYTKAEVSDFDQFANLIKQKTYTITACSKETAVVDGIDADSQKKTANERTHDFYKTHPKVEGIQLYRSALTGYSNSGIVGTGAFYLGRPVSVETQDKEGKTLGLSLMKYDNQNRPNETWILDNQNIRSGVDIQAQKSKVGYDNYGNTVEQTVYGSDGKVKLTGKNGNVWEYTLTEPADPRITKMIYDSQYAAFLKTTENPLSHKTQITYDFEVTGIPVLGLAVKSVDANKLATQMAYDSFGRINKKVLPGDSLQAPSARYEYFDNQLSKTNAPFALKTEILDKNVGANAVYLTAWLFYDSFGRKIQSQSQGSVPGNLFVDLTEYDGLGRVVNQYSSSEQSSSAGCGLVFGKYASCVSRDFVLKTKYDDQGRAVRTTSPDGTCALIRYEGRRTISFDPQMAKTVSEKDIYNRDWQGISYINPNTAVLGVSVEKPTLKQKLSGLLAKVVYFFSKITRGENVARQVQLAGVCQSSAIVYPGDSGYGVYTATEQFYDALDRPVKSVTKDSQNRILAAYETGYDGFNRVLFTIDPDLGRNEVKVYDGLGNQLQTKDNAGYYKSYVYDKLGRLTDICLDKICASGGGSFARLVYDEYPGMPYLSYAAKGRLVAEITPNVLEKIYRYNAKGQNYSTYYKLLIDQDKFPGKDTIESYTFYDAGGKPVTETFGNLKTGQEWVKDLIDTVSYSYDAIGRVEKIESGHSEKNDKGTVTVTNNKEAVVQGIKYNQFGALTEVRLPNNTLEKYVFNETDRSLRLVSHTVQKGNDMLLGLSYPVYDKAGNITQMKDTVHNKTVNYAYDSFYRLVQATGDINASYRYDELSRMTVKDEK